jgi:hypothetical protein
MLVGNNIDFKKTPTWTKRRIIKKTLTGETSNGKNVDKGTKGRREKTLNLYSREYFKGLHTDTY